MSRYYFLGCALPELSLDKVPEITVDELNKMLEMNLSSIDIQKLNSLKLLNDLSNLKAFLSDEPISSNGNFDATQIEDILLAKVDLPEFAIDFLDKYDTAEDRLKHFSELMSLFFQWAQEEFDGFLKKYFDLERKTSLSLTALRAKKFNRSFEKEFQFEDLSDPFVAYLLSQKDMESIELEEGFEKLSSIFKEHLKNPMDLQKALIEWKLEQIYEIKRQYPFEIDEILGYYTSLMLIENWNKLNKADNKNIIDQLSRE